jgi:hypothetical protein
MSEELKSEERAYEMGYRISTDGLTVTWNQKPVKYHLYKGYYRFSFGPKIRRRNINLHRLQAFHKYGRAMYAPGLVCRHLNGNSQDNHYNNIAIGTQSQNMMDRSPEARLQHAKHAAQHLVKHDYAAVYAYFKEHGFKSAMIHFGISSKGTMSHIINHPSLKTTCLAVTAQ